MAIQTSKVEIYFELLAESLPWLLFFRCSNYANSVAVSLALWLQLRNWNHPLMAWLKVHFKATSEEYGETAIHFMSSHLNECNYDGKILEERWTDSAVAMEICSELDLSLSHKPSCPKMFQFSNPNYVYRAIHRSYVQLMSDIESNSHRCFVISPQSTKSGFTSNSNRELSDKAWEKRFGRANLKRMRIAALAHCEKIYAKLTKSINDESYGKVDLSWAFD